MKGFRITGCLVAGLLLLVQATPVFALQTIRIGGNGSAMGAMRLLGQAYERSHPGVRVSVVPGLGSSGGLKALAQGALELAVSARELRTEEQAAGLNAIEYARSPFLFAAHAKVTRTGLTGAELARLYRQEAATWPDGTRVRLVLRPVKDTDTVMVQQLSAEMQRAVLAAHARPGMVIATTDGDCLDTIEAMPGALGTATLTELLTESRRVHALALDGVAPSLDNLASGRYRLAKTFYLVGAAKNSRLLQEFSAFLASPQGRELLRKTGNLPPRAGKEN